MNVQIDRQIDNDVLSYDAYKVYEIQGNGLLVTYSRHMSAIVTQKMSVIMLQYRTSWSDDVSERRFFESLEN